MDKQPNLSKRNVGGKRVVCKCTFLFPKADVFSSAQMSKSGVLVFNVRGGCFYSNSSLDEKSISAIFAASKVTTLPLVRLTFPGSPDISLNKLQTRFIKFKHTVEKTGIVLRFVHQTEQQLELLNSLTDSLPSLEESEEVHVNAVMKA